MVRGLRLDPGRHRRDPHRHAAWTAEGAAALARLHQRYRECDGHGAARLPQRKTLALGLDGDALDRSRDAGSSQRLPTTEGSQATSSVTCRPGSAPDKKLNPRRACSPSQHSLTSISVATASQCSTNNGTSRVLFLDGLWRLDFDNGDCPEMTTVLDWVRDHNQ